MRKGYKKTSQISFRVSKEDKETMQILAEEQDRTLGDYILVTLRNIILEANKNSDEKMFAEKEERIKRLANKLK